MIDYEEYKNHKSFYDHDIKNMIQLAETISNPQIKYTVTKEQYLNRLNYFVNSRGLEESGHFAIIRNRLEHEADDYIVPESFIAALSHAIVNHYIIESKRNMLWKDK